MDLAVIRFSDDIVDPWIEDKYFEDYKLGVRLKDFQIQPNIKLNLLGQLGYRTGIDDSPYQDENGYSLGHGLLTQKVIFTIELLLFIAKGVNMVDNPYSGKGLLEISASGEELYDLENASDFQILSDIQYDDKTKHGLLGAVTYQHKDFGVTTAEGNDKTFTHLNATGRYSHYLSDQFALTLEAGYDYISQKDVAKGSFGKVTFFPEIKWNKGMSSRLAIRPFITYATWSDELKGQVGVFNGYDAYGDKTSGLTAGVQLEIWW